MLTEDTFNYYDDELNINERQKSQIEEYKNTILIDKKKELLKFIKENIEKGNNITSNIKYIYELVEIISKWYEFKYTDNKISMLEEKYLKRNSFFSFNTTEYKVENLNINMGYTELMFRMPKYLYPILECWYKENNKDFSNDNYIKATISTKNTLNEFDQNVSFDKYDGRFKFGQRILNEIVILDCRTIEKLLIDEYKYPNIDFSDLKSIELTHNLDLELRQKTLDLIAVNLLFSSKNLIVGYVRSIKFIEEFNKYLYNLNLSSREINNIILELNIYNFSPVSNYILNKLEEDKYEDLSIEEFGLSFNTICYLKQNNIYKLSDILKRNFDIRGDGIFNNYIPEQDIIIYEKMQKLASDYYSNEKPHLRPNNYTIANIKEEPNEEKIEESPKKQKKLFKRFRK